MKAAVFPDRGRVIALAFTDVTIAEYGKRTKMNRISQVIICPCVKKKGDYLMAQNIKSVFLKWRVKHIRR